MFAIGSILGMISTVAAVIVYLRKGRGPGPALGLLGIPGALALVYTVVDAFGIPTINDISTDRIYPPEFVHAATLPENADRDLEFPAVNRELSEKFYPDVRPLPSTESVDDVFIRALELAEAQPGWEITARRVEADVSTFEGTVTSPVFHFVDDFVVRITRAGDDGSVIDMRSKSRDGTSDLGVNAKRIREFLDKL